MKKVSISKKEFCRISEALGMMVADLEISLEGKTSRNLLWDRRLLRKWDDLYPRKWPVQLTVKS